MENLMSEFQHWQGMRLTFTSRSQSPGSPPGPQGPWDCRPFPCLTSSAALAPPAQGGSPGTEPPPRHPPVCPRLVPLQAGPAPAGPDVWVARQAICSRKGFQSGSPRLGGEPLPGSGLPAPRTACSAEAPGPVHTSRSVGRMWGGWWDQQESSVHACEHARVLRHVHVSVCTSVHACARVSCMHMYANVSLWARAHEHRCMGTHVHARRSVCETRVFTCTQKYVCVCTRAYVGALLPWKYAEFPQHLLVKWRHADSCSRLLPGPFPPVGAVPPAKGEDGVRARKPTCRRSPWTHSLWVGRCLFSLLGASGRGLFRDGVASQRWIMTVITPGPSCVFRPHVPLRPQKPTARGEPGRPVLVRGRAGFLPAGGIKRGSPALCWPHAACSLPLRSASLGTPGACKALSAVGLL
uniref:uncharacterized protein LOC129523136 n=1 Tax=Nyctereutes procyonoides TaxID=34880 RepID=UPI002443C59C|nr:uncharacterized protein LOC129523136 [Nyctereutes procyonoides]